MVSSRRVATDTVIVEKEILFPLSELKKNLLKYSSNQLLLLSVSVIGDAARYGEEKRCAHALYILNILRKNRNVAAFVKVLKDFSKVVKSRFDYLKHENYDVFYSETVQISTEDKKDEKESSASDKTLVSSGKIKNLNQKQSTEKPQNSNDNQRSLLDEQTRKTRILFNEKAFEIFHTTNSGGALKMTEEIEVFIDSLRSAANDIASNSKVIESQIKQDNKKIKYFETFVNLIINFFTNLMEKHSNEAFSLIDETYLIFTKFSQKCLTYPETLISDVEALKFPYNAYPKSLFEPPIPKYGSSNEEVPEKENVLQEIGSTGKEDDKTEKRSVDEPVVDENTKKQGKIDSNLYGPNPTLTMRAICSPLEVTFYFAVLLGNCLNDMQMYTELAEYGEILKKNVIRILHDYPKTCQAIDTILGKAISLYALNAERVMCLEDIRYELLSIYEISKNSMCLAVEMVTMNLILRNYVLARQYDLAYLFLKKTTYKTSYRSIAEHSRYCYYSGLIYAARMEYSKAHANFLQCVRQAPKRSPMTLLELKVDQAEKKKDGESKKTELKNKVAATANSSLVFRFVRQKAPGFYVAALKASIVSSLLLGEIPDRKLVNDKSLLRKHLPYEYLIHTVFQGDMTYFAKLLQQYRHVYTRDNLLFLVQRLHQSVLRSAVRLLINSYSRISLRDVAEKIGLQDESAAESVLMKAIHDNTISAHINHENGEVQAKMMADVYTTTEPCKALQRRVKFLLNIEESAIQALYKS